MKSKIEQIIEDVINNNEFWQPKMIIEEKEPFFWRLNPDFVKEKSSIIADKVMEVVKNEIFEKYPFSYKRNNIEDQTVDDILQLLNKEEKNENLPKKM